MAPIHTGQNPQAYLTAFTAYLVNASMCHHLFKHTDGHYMNLRQCFPSLPFCGVCLTVTKDRSRVSMFISQTALPGL